MSCSIGVLAGMGPRSTAPFIDMLVSACQSLYGAKDDMDFPKMHIISLPTPFYPDRDIDDRKMASALQSGIQDLVKARVDLMVVPCNLAHRYFAEMKAVSAGIPLLHIADCAIKNIPFEANSIAVIATEPTIQAGFYQQRLAAANKTAVSSPELRIRTTELIALIKQHGFAHEGVKAGWRSVLSVAAALGAQAALIACTDLSPLIHGNPKTLIMVDTAAGLAQAAIEQYLGIRAERGDDSDRSPA